MAVVIGELVNFSASNDDGESFPQMDERYGPYNSVSEALTAIKYTRCVGLTIGIKNNDTIIEYWFQGGIADSNLVKKVNTAYNGYADNGGTKSEADFYSTLTKIVDTSSYLVLHSNVDDLEVKVKVSRAEATEVGSSIVYTEQSSTDSSTSTITPSNKSNTLAYLQIDTKDLDVNSSESSRTVNVSISNSGNSSTYVLDGNIINHSYSGIGDARDCKVTLSLPLSTYEQVIGFYDSKTGELLSNEQTYEFDTPSNGMSYITIKFKS